MNTPTTRAGNAANTASQEPVAGSVVSGNVASQAAGSETAGAETFVSGAATPGATQIKGNQPLPPLREDLQIFKGGRNWQGEQVWTIFDPLRNRYFQLSDHDLAIMTHWHRGTADRLRASVDNEERYQVSHEQVEEFLDFLIQAELVQAVTPALRVRMARINAARQHSWWQTLLHSYLSFRMPLLRPDHLLNGLYPHLQWLFTTWFVLCSLGVGLWGLYHVLPQWQTFWNTSSAMFTVQGWLVFTLTLASVKILHEFGHALMSKHYGLRVPTMGVAFIVMWPILYTDSTDAWRLTSHHKRAMISAAGVITESLIACYALAAWVFLPEGIARSIAFSAVTTIWVTSVLVNLNPVVKFDGYYFVSDMFNMPNLQDRAFALARWQLRTWLFDLQVQPPEIFPRRRHAAMLGYAFFVWIYRFFLFLGIAFLVYHFFFKALGILLFAVEMWWFILRPIVMELKVWGGLTQAMSHGRRRLGLLLLLILALILLFPWRSDLVLPARVVDIDFVRVFPSSDARLVSLQVQEGQRVQPGQILLELSSPDLEQQALVAAQELRRAQARLSSAGAGAQEERYNERLILEQEVQRAQSVAQALAREQERLTIRATQAGVVRELMPALRPGQWLARRQHLLTLIGGQHYKVEAWANEAQRQALPERAEARFYPERDVGLQPLPVVLAKVEHTALGVLDPPYQASVFGGDLSVTPEHDGSMIPREALYRVHFVQAPDKASGAMPGQSVRGWVRIEGERRVLLWQGLKQVLAILLRESGF